jgi:peptide deformylase
MSLLKIIHCGDSTLRQKSKPVRKITRDTRKLVQDMFDTMEDSKGIGLAAPQVRVLKKVITLHVPEYRPLALIDPEITFMSSEETTFSEGCLSIPGFEGAVVRPERIIIEAIDDKGEAFSLEAEGVLSRCIQHEIDHLSGILFPDRMGEEGKALIKQFLSEKGKKR